MGHYTRHTRIHTDSKSKDPIITNSAQITEIIVSFILHQNESFQAIELLRQTAIGTSLPSQEELAMIVHILKE
jgi:hypothetical protein